MKGVGFKVQGVGCRVSGAGLRAACRAEARLPAPPPEASPGPVWLGAFVEGWASHAPLSARWAPGGMRFGFTVWWLGMRRRVGVEEEEDGNEEEED